jgi:hypothetical protein
MATEPSEARKQERPIYIRYLLVAAAVVLLGALIVGAFVAYNYIPESIQDRLQRIRPGRQVFSYKPDYEDAIEPAELILAREKLRAQALAALGPTNLARLVNDGDGGAVEINAPLLMKEMDKINRHVRVGFNWRVFFIVAAVVISLASIVAVVFFQRHSLMPLVGLDPNAGLFRDL